MKKFYSDHYINEKGKNYFDWQSIGGQNRGRINSRKFSPHIHPNDIVLDFGCGNGSLLQHVNCRRRIGIEVNPVAIEQARKAGIEIHEDLSNIDNNIIDVVISNHVLEHLLCPLQSLKELRKKIVKGGKIILCVPIDDWRTQKKWHSGDINHHLYTWTPQLMGELLVEAGFEIENIWILTHAWPPNSWQKLDKLLPVWLFDLVCFLTAIRYKRRQIMAIAVNS
jgi:SAM-dependent methyltransferase